MKTILKLEELAQFLVGCYAFGFFDLQWWWFIALFFTPDFSMLGYLFGNKTGALLYNLFHHKAVAILILVTGITFTVELLQVAGVILYSHSAFDRMLGYGLKYKAGFRFTHLDEIGGLAAKDINANKGVKG